MILQLKNKSRTESLVKRAFFLAYQACGGAMGMGVFQSRDGITEAHVWNNVLTRGDYPPGATVERPERPYGDYVFGRMMKLSCEFSESNGTVTISDSKPRPDYQAWCVRYKTYKDLFISAAKELGISIEGENIEEKPAQAAAKETPLPPGPNPSPEEIQRILDMHPLNIKPISVG